ncbi:nuclear transport factor 2 family protein [Microbacterium soli]|uniref:SnoaL-like domain-containing protein n=1 Tax=Microbacterium soli TaxID=446075 RepID=A0ABP7MVG0_9MICO
MSDIGRLLDARRITALLSSRAVASDDHDVERMVACHTEDGMDDHGDGLSAARRFIEDVAATRYRDPDNGPQKHVLANVIIDFIDDHSAFAESYHLAYHRMGMTGTQTDDLVGGRYLDLLRRVHGQWRIQKRTVVYDWSRGLDARDPARPRRASIVREQEPRGSSKESEDMSDNTALDELIDKDAITRVLYTRARAADRRDHALALSCYHEGATEVHEGYSTTAKDFLLEKSLYAPGKEAPSHTLMHLITNVLIDLRGDEAFVESYHLCLMSGGTGEEETDTMIGGRYLDTFRRIDGRWAIAHREVTFDWSRTEPAVRRFWDDNENKHLISFGDFGPEDPLYRYVERGVAPGEA